MTKKELEELVQVQAARIAELEQEVAGLKARNAAPVAAVQRLMTPTMPTIPSTCSNSPWPNFCVATPRAVKR